MQIGLNAAPRPEDAGYWRDLGVQWCKWAMDVATAPRPDSAALAPVSDDRRQLDYAQSLGIRVCIDLRTSAATMHLLAMQGYEDAAKAGLLRTLPEGRSEEEQTAIIIANQRIANAELMQVLIGRVREHVELHRSYCRDWEWWGEWDCPRTSRGVFHQIAYPETLRAVYTAIKEVQPEARVWTGGNGMDLSDGWVQNLREDGALQSFDVLNWHPYPMSLRDRPTIEERLQENYGGWRKTLKAEGRNQWFASTEWGYPSLGRATRRQRQWLESHVVEGGISQLYPEEALVHYEGDLRLMEKYDFQVVMVHTLRDTASRHWGTKSGLLMQPASGLRGRVRRWAGLERKPIYQLVRDWAWRGRLLGGKPFTEEPK